MGREGFTIIEIMTVVIIIAILATLAVPPLIKTMDAAKGRLAKTNLKLILAAEKVYRNEVGAYMPITGGRVGAEHEWFKKYLGLDLKETDFEYEVDTSGDPVNRFTAVALPKKKYQETGIISINQDGTLSGNYPPQ
ncbi:MAG: prepilin-type N-terminal cleavage/methylation domain-containing protein [Candidatus Omnitrophica bacterium]|nr:prepilin-type N-terminal cleavage/methylation domain-containing protein [Candidatus Omnitrophota bacterium]MCM8793905.1 prepilin-type N-terminal cleavage/methylation domain-containing protein [Candidatus Omnitrophota bacterium]